MEIGTIDMFDYIASDSYIVVNKNLIKTFGLNEAVLLGELCSEYRYWAKEDKLEDDWFYSTIENIEENTGLTAHEQRQAIKSLENAGVLQTELKGVPARKYFYIDKFSVVKILTTSCEKTAQQDVKKLHSNNNNKSNNKNNKTISKDIVEKSPKTKKLSLWDKCVSAIDDFTEDNILRELLVASLKMFMENSRESGIAFYTNHFKGKLNNLKKLSEDNYQQRKIVQQTLDNGWNNFYELKENKRKTRDFSKDVEGLNEGLNKQARKGVKPNGTQY